MVRGTKVLPIVTFVEQESHEALAWPMFVAEADNPIRAAGNGEAKSLGIETADLQVCRYLRSIVCQRLPYKVVL